MAAFAECDFLHWLMEKTMSEPPNRSTHADRHMEIFKQDFGDAFIDSLK